MANFDSDNNTQKCQNELKQDKFADANPTTAALSFSRLQIFICCLLLSMVIAYTVLQIIKLDSKK